MPVATTLQKHPRNSVGKQELPAAFQHVQIRIWHCWTVIALNIVPKVDVGRNPVPAGQLLEQSP